MSAFASWISLADWDKGLPLRRTAATGIVGHNSNNRVFRFFCVGKVCARSTDHEKDRDRAAYVLGFLHHLFFLRFMSVAFSFTVTPGVSITPSPSWK